MTPVRLEPAAPWSRVKHSTTEPLRSNKCTASHNCDMTEKLLKMTFSPNNLFSSFILYVKINTICGSKSANIFLHIRFNIGFGCSKELSRDGSFEYPQHMFWLRNKKVMFLETMFSQNICFHWYHIHKIHTKSPYH